MLWVTRSLTATGWCAPLIPALGRERSAWCVVGPKDSHIHSETPVSKQTTKKSACLSLSICAVAEAGVTHFDCHPHCEVLRWGQRGPLKGEWAKPHVPVIPGRV